MERRGANEISWNEDKRVILNGGLRQRLVLSVHLDRREALALLKSIHRVLITQLVSPFSHNIQIFYKVMALFTTKSSSVSLVSGPNFSGGCGAASMAPKLL